MLYRDTRRTKVAFLLISVSVGLLMASAQLAGAVQIPYPDLKVRFGGQLQPRALSSSVPTAITLTMSGSFSTIDGKQVPALREAVVDFDAEGEIRAGSLPVCGRRTLESTTLQKASVLCEAARVGSGFVVLDVGQGDSPRLPLKIFNGGQTRSATTLIAATALPGVSNASMAAIGKVKPVKGQPGFGLRSIWKIPQFFGGRASVRSFEITLGRVYREGDRRESYLKAMCADGQLEAKIVRAKFRDEAASGVGDFDITGTAFSTCK